MSFATLFVCVGLLFLGFSLGRSGAEDHVQPPPLPEAISPDAGDGGTTFAGVPFPLALEGAGVELALDDWLTRPTRALVVSCCCNVAPYFWLRQKPVAKVAPRAEVDRSLTSVLHKLFKQVGAFTMAVAKAA